MRHTIIIALYIIASCCCDQLLNSNSDSIIANIVNKKYSKSSEVKCVIESSERNGIDVNIRLLKSSETVGWSHTTFIVKAYGQFSDQDSIMFTDSKQYSSTMYTGLINF